MIGPYLLFIDQMSSPEEIYEKERHLLDIVYDLIESDDLSGLFGTLKELEDLSHDQFICLTYSAFQRLI